MAAAQTGETAEATSSGGGIFTGALLRSMKKLGGSENPTWDSIFQEAATKTRRNSSDGSQHPSFAIEPCRALPDSCSLDDFVSRLARIPELCASMHEPTLPQDQVMGQ
jgi:hypothetical protein